MMERSGGGGPGGGPRYYSRQRRLVFHTIRVFCCSEATAARGRNHVDGGNERNRVLVTELCSDTSLDHKSQIHQSRQNKSSAGHLLRGLDGYLKVDPLTVVADPDKEGGAAAAQELKLYKTKWRVGFQRQSLI